MIFKLSFVLTLALFFATFDVSYGQVSGCKPPNGTVGPNSRFILFPNCLGYINLPKERCHCWGNCAYICDPCPATAAKCEGKYPWKSCTTDDCANYL